MPSSKRLHSEGNARFLSSHWQPKEIPKRGWRFSFAFVPPKDFEKKDGNLFGELQEVCFEKPGLGKAAFSEGKPPFPVSLRGTVIELSAT